MIRLPENPDERKKAIAAIALGVVVLLFVTFMYGLQPYLASIRARKERVTELEDEIWRAEKEIKAMDRIREQNNDIVTRILNESEVKRHILRPSLGNYLLVATEVINQAASGIKISIEAINEMPAPAVTTKKGQAKNQQDDRFAPYTINLSLTAGLHDLARFIHRLESGNPYLAVTRLIVMAQSSENPEQHFISIHLQWPIWVDDEHPQRLKAERIADEERQ